MNLITQVGIDLIDHQKFIRFNPNQYPNFYQRVFTEIELEYCQGRISRFAGTFAAKEACYKALSEYGITYLSQFEIIHFNGKPKVKDLFYDNKVGIITIEEKDYWVNISISHGIESSIAMALAGSIENHVS